MMVLHSEANISAAGEVTAYSFSGGMPRYQPLVEQPDNRSNIFWMPRFPDKPIKIGDTFTHTISLDSSGGGAGGQTVFELKEVRESLARFGFRCSGCGDKRSGRRNADKRWARSL